MKGLVSKVGLLGALVVGCVGIEGIGCNTCNYAGTHWLYRDMDIGCGELAEKVRLLGDDSADRITKFVLGTYGIKEAFERIYNARCKGTKLMD